MPELTPNLGLKKPLGNETVNRAAYNENLDILDQKAVKKGAGIAELLGGTLAERPGPEIPGRYYFAQDKGEIWLDTGTKWVLAAASRTDFAAHLAEDATEAHQIANIAGLQAALDGKSPIGHNHSGVYEPVDSNIMRRNTAQTMAAQLKAQNNTAYTTFQVRNIVLSTSDPSGGGDGDIWIKYV